MVSILLMRGHSTLSPALTTSMVESQNNGLLMGRFLHLFHLAKSLVLLFHPHIGARTSADTHSSLFSLLSLSLSLSLKEHKVMKLVAAMIDKNARLTKLDLSDCEIKVSMKHFGG